MTRPAFLFDLDGTLVDSALGIASALTALSASRGGGVIAPEVVRPLVSRGVEELVATALGGMARDAQGDIAAFRCLLAAQPTDHNMVYAGVRAALERLNDAGAALAIVTNKPERLARQLLEQLDLARMFLVIVGGDTLARRKPDPLPLTHAVSCLGAVDRSMFIGDSAVDAGAAAAANVPFVLFTGGYGAEECDKLPVAARFCRFDEIDSVLGARADTAPCPLPHA